MHLPIDNRGERCRICRRWLWRRARSRLAWFALAAALAIHILPGRVIAAEPIFDFAIAAQPLGSALLRYGDITGKEALYEGSLIEGRFSSGVEGRITSKDALDRLLVGTDLVARVVEEGAFVLEPAVTRAAPPLAARHYDALVRRSILDTLCKSRETQPGRYRLVTVLWIAPDGAVQDVLTVGSAGQPETDQLIDRSLRAMRFREPPPAGFVQPVRLLFVPQLSDAKSICPMQGGAP